MASITLQKRGEIIRSPREKFDERNDQLPLLFAGPIIEGGIVDYNTNLLTGGIGARYLGIGASKQYREDTKGFIRVVSVRQGNIT